MLRQLVIGLTLSCCLSSTAWSDTLSFFHGDGGAYSDTEDTFINSSSEWQEANFSTESWLYVDQEDGSFGNGTSSALIRFPDAFGPHEGQVPLEAEILSASIQIYVQNPGETIEVYEILEDWDVDEVSWVQRSEALGDWAVAGADEHPSHATKVLEEFDGKEGRWTILNVEQAAKYWAEQPDQNFGVLLRATGTDGTDIPSSEHSEVTYRPLLIVVFSLPDDWEPKGEGEDTGESDGGADTQDTASGEDSGSGSGSGGSEDDSGSASTAGGDPDSDGDQLSTGACGCAMGGPPMRASGAVWLLLLWVWRRRSREGCH